jgi:hypothetical protein
MEVSSKINRQETNCVRWDWTLSTPAALRPSCCHGETGWWTWRSGAAHADQPGHGLGLVRESVGEIRGKKRHTLSKLHRWMLCWRKRETPGTDSEDRRENWVENEDKIGLMCVRHPIPIAHAIFRRRPPPTKSDSESLLPSKHLLLLLSFSLVELLSYTYIYISRETSQLSTKRVTKNAKYFG